MLQLNTGNRFWPLLWNILSSLLDIFKISNQSNEHLRLRKSCHCWTKYITDKACTKKKQTLVWLFFSAPHTAMGENISVNFRQCETSRTEGAYTYEQTLPVKPKCYSSSIRSDSINANDNANAKPRRHCSSSSWRFWPALARQRSSSSGRKFCPEVSWGEEGTSGNVSLQKELTDVILLFLSIVDTL